MREFFWLLGGLRVSPKALTRGRQEGQMRARERGEGHVTTEAGGDSEMPHCRLWGLRKNHEPGKAALERKGFFLRASGGHGALPGPWCQLTETSFRPAASRTGKE